MTGDQAVGRVDFCITTFKRPRAVERLMLSIGKRYPGAAVSVADQNETVDRAFYDELAARAGLARTPEIHQLEFDCGVSAARNHLATSTPRELKLILDDDFVFTDRTRVEALISLLDANPGAGVAGGGVTDGGRLTHFSTLFERHGDTLVQRPDDRPFATHDGIRFRETCCVPNFALIRRELFEHVQWDPLQKIVEHYDFYIRVQQTPFAVVYTPDITVDHPPVVADDDYRRFRRRGGLLQPLLAKHGISRLESPNGTITELSPDGFLTQYCELR